MNSRARDEMSTAWNVIVGGHSHTRLKKPKFINGVIIVQTGFELRKPRVCSI